MARWVEEVVRWLGTVWVASCGVFLTIKREDAVTAWNTWFLYPWNYVALVVGCILALCCLVLWVRKMRKPPDGEIPDAIKPQPPPRRGGVRIINPHFESNNTGMRVDSRANVEVENPTFLKNNQGLVIVEGGESEQTSERPSQGGRIVGLQAEGCYGGVLIEDLNASIEIVDPKLKNNDSGIVIAPADRRNKK